MAQHKHECHVYRPAKAICVRQSPCQAGECQKEGQKVRKGRVCSVICVLRFYIVFSNSQETRIEVAYVSIFGVSRFYEHLDFENLHGSICF